MCQINPMSEIRAIAETCRRKCLPANARLLWRVLFDCANDRQERNAATNTYDWPDGFFPITNDELRTNSALEKRALLEARNALKEIGAIDFIPGENNRRPASYRIRYLTAGRDRYVPASGTAKTPAYGPADVPIYKEIYKDISGEKNSVRSEEDDDNDDRVMNPRARGEDRDPVPDREERNEAIRRGFVYAIGREPYPAELDRLVTESWGLDFSPVMVSLALRKAALYQPVSPVNYTVEILVDWRSNHVRLPHHVEQYEAEHSQQAGKLGFRTAEQIEEQSKAARRKRYLENIRNGIDDIPL